MNATGMSSESAQSQATEKAHGQIGKAQSAHPTQPQRPKMSLSKQQPPASISTGRSPLAAQQRSSISTIGTSTSTARICCLRQQLPLRARRVISRRGWSWAISIISPSNLGTMLEPACRGMLLRVSWDVRSWVLCLLVIAFVRPRNLLVLLRLLIRLIRTILNPRPKVVSETKI